MLGISTKGHYGLVIMTALAGTTDEKPLSLARIAEETEISLGYLEQIVSTLREAGLVESTRGAKGGYVLGRAPAEITALQIILATEREIAPISCSLQPEEGVCCERIDYCPTVFLWGAAGAATQPGAGRYHPCGLGAAQPQQQAARPWADIRDAVAGECVARARCATIKAETKRTIRDGECTARRLSWQ